MWRVDWFVTNCCPVPCLLCDLLWLIDVIFVYWESTTDVGQGGMSHDSSGDGFVGGSARPTRVPRFGLLVMSVHNFVSQLDISNLTVCLYLEQVYIPVSLPAVVDDPSPHGTRTSLTVIGTTRCEVNGTGRGADVIGPVCCNGEQ